ncbi:MAG: hypothetical protein EXR98_13275 [Gemmataceae bacterium]|nr:hypothetical protein [Gemmataceae bacterium]
MTRTNRFPNALAKTTSLKFIVLALAVCLIGSPALAQGRKTPPGMFRDLDDEIVGKAILIHGKQLFIDDYLIEELKDAAKVLNQPVKHPRNPLFRRDKDLEFAIGYGAVVHDKRDGLYKMWYGIWNDAKDSVGTIGYASSKDGIIWEKTIIDKQAGNNVVVFEPKEAWVGGAGVIIDSTEKDPERRFKMMYLAKPTLKSSSLRSCVAYSADAMHWKQEPKNPVMPYSDTQIAPYWDTRLGRFVAYLRFGPPNVRIISRTESEDFVHWSPKATVINTSKLDGPFNTVHYTMAAMPFAGVTIGLLNTYHGETIKPIPKDKLWMDRVDVQLVFSRNGVTWQRVGKDGAISAKELRGERDWKKAAEQAVFIPYGEYQKDWDWGQIYPHHAPLVVGDEIRFYYTGISSRHWSTYHKDKPDHGIGLATLRLDGFVSVEAKNEGTLTTRPLMFLGDTLVVNANAAGGSLRVEALDGEGKPIPGFQAADCQPITSDGIRHVVTWKKNPDCHLLQARPIKLRFHLNNAKLYSFEPGIRHKHYLQSYD